MSEGEDEAKTPPPPDPPSKMEEEKKKEEEVEVEVVEEEEEEEEEEVFVHAEIQNNDKGGPTIIKLEVHKNDFPQTKKILKFNFELPRPAAARTSPAARLLVAPPR